MRASDPGGVVVRTEPTMTTTPSTGTNARPDAAASAPLGRRPHGGPGDRPARPPRPQVILEVQRTEWITPHMVRVTAGGAGFANFAPSPASDAYVKIVFVKPELGLEPPYDMPSLRETLAPEDRPVTRTYTVRSVDRAAGTIDIDFVVHGDEGLAGPWAANARPGDQLVFMGPGGGYRPDPTADWHLLAGDESALPAIAAALEAMPADAEGIAVIEAGSDADRIELTAPAGIEIRWALRDGRGAGTTTVLADAVAAVEWREGRVQVFAHGERESMKALRDVLKPHGIDRSMLSLSGYWAYGRSEDRFQAEKREPIGRILTD